MLIVFSWQVMAAVKGLEIYAHLLQIAVQNCSHC